MDVTSQVVTEGTPSFSVFSVLMEGDHPAGTSLITAVVIPVPHTPIPRVADVGDKWGRDVCYDSVRVNVNVSGEIWQGTSHH